MVKYNGSPATALNVSEERLLSPSTVSLAQGATDNDRPGVYMHVHISRHRNYGYVLADDCL